MTVKWTIGSAILLALGSVSAADAIELAAGPATTSSIGSSTAATAGILAPGVARRVDQAIAKGLFGEGWELAPRAADETFLRRVYLDLVGDIPTPEALTAFLLDPAADKRERVVQELLDNPQYHCRDIADFSWDSNSMCPMPCTPP